MQLVNVEIAELVRFRVRFSHELENRNRIVNSTLFLAVLNPCNHFTCVFLYISSWKHSSPGSPSPAISH